jgi:hypothetical protein
MNEQFQGYQPSQEEVQKAEEMMTPGEERSSELREKTKKLQEILKQFAAEKLYYFLNSGNRSTVKPIIELAQKVAEEMGDIYMAETDRYLRLFASERPYESDGHFNSTGLLFVESTDWNERVAVSDSLNKRLGIVDKQNLDPRPSSTNYVQKATLTHFTKRESEEV